MSLLGTKCLECSSCQLCPSQGAPGTRFMSKPRSTTRFAPRWWARLIAEAPLFPFHETRPARLSIPSGFPLPIVWIQGTRFRIVAQQVATIPPKHRSSCSFHFHQRSSPNQQTSTQGPSLKAVFTPTTLRSWIGVRSMSRRLGPPPMMKVVSPSHILGGVHHRGTRRAFIRPRSRESVLPLP